jgi:lipoyl-dependent peroxiredoxin
MKRKANAVWNGSLKGGSGKITTQSTVLNNTKYDFNSRFGYDKSTNPEELLAAAHAGCFAMALSLILGKAGFTADSLKVTSVVSKDPDKLDLTGSHLTLKAKIPNISKDKFMECANAAKQNCPISKALSLEITLDAELEKSLLSGENINSRKKQPLSC